MSKTNDTPRELTIEELDTVSGGQNPPDPDRIMLGGPDTRIMLGGPDTLPAFLPRT